MERSWLHIGHVIAVEPARRCVLVDPLRGCEEVVKRSRRLRLQAAADESQVFSVRVINVQSGARGVRVQLSPGISRDLINQLNQAKVLIAADAFPPEFELPPILEQFLGMRVVGPGGIEIGTVFEAFETPAGLVLRLNVDGSRSAALPFIKEVIQKIDKASGIITVADPAPFLVMNDQKPDPSSGPKTFMGSAL